MLQRLTTAAVAAKNRALPAEPSLRRLPLGIGRGVTMEIDFRDQTRMFLGLYEVELNRYLRELCSPGADCFDVGGQSGYDALVLAKLTHGRVRSFECDANAVQTIRRVVAANRALDGIEVVHCRVAAFSSPEHNHLSLDEAAFGLDSLVPDVVKLDVDGDEVNAIRGAGRLLHERHPHIIVETHSPPLERECVRLLREAGYAPAIVNQRRWLKDYRPLPHNRWLLARGNPRAGR